MELNQETITTPPRAAATVVMLRDMPTGLEVFLMKRHSLSDVLGGAYVFPGGKVDARTALAMLKRRPASPMAAPVTIDAAVVAQVRQEIRALASPKA